jgi:ATP-binding protein involved in chromosome partitioning
MKKNKTNFVLAVAAGKGGVGKSSVSVNLALSLAEVGARVGVLDADLYGPSLGKMMQAELEVHEEDGYILPAKFKGVYFVSLAHFTIGKEATIVRAPIANQLIEQFLTEVKWPELDFLIIDFPPGTGDIQLSIMQQATLSGALLVTTPQQVALLDVEKAYQMFSKMQVPILGIVENMSYYKVSESEMAYPFGKDHVIAFAKEKGLEYLGQIPIDQSISLCADQGESLFEQAPFSPGAVAFEKIRENIFSILMKDKKFHFQNFKRVDLLWNNQL